VLDFLKEDGRCALLVSSGVLFKLEKSIEFRNNWMKKVCLYEVFNFSNVCSLFFNKATSPFVMVHFGKESQGNIPVEYWSAQKTAANTHTQSISLSKNDRALLVGQDLADIQTWKTNWFGRPADVSFIHKLGRLKVLKKYVMKNGSGRGYQTYEPKHSGQALECTNALSKIPNRYDKLDFSAIPSHVYNLGPLNVYQGKKIIVKEGVYNKENNGWITARYENNNFCFYRSVYGIKLEEDNEDAYLLILGILWSSLIRYYLFLTTSSWGTWNYKILLNELLQLPLPSVMRGRYAKNVISVVQKLRNFHPEEKTTLNPNGIPTKEIKDKREYLEDRLNKAVFDLYRISPEERDLIKDCCEVTLPFKYDPYNSKGAEVTIKDGNVKWITNYAKIFAKRWQPYLNDNEVMRADVHLGASNNMVAIEFYPADKGDKWNLTPKEDSWEYVLEEIGKALQTPMGTSQIVLDGMVHVVSDDAIIIIKRNEKRFWTRSLAREDAGSTLAKRMLETMPSDGGVE